MAPQIQTTDWRSIAEQASTEMDSGKLAILVAELCRVLDGDPRRMKIPVAANQAMAIAFVGANEHPPPPGTVRNPFFRASHDAVQAIGTRRFTQEPLNPTGFKNPSRLRVLSCSARRIVAPTR